MRSYRNDMTGALATSPRKTALPWNVRGREKMEFSVFNLEAVTKESATRKATQG
jgi:hypothetical protein